MANSSAFAVNSAATSSRMDITYPPGMQVIERGWLIAT